MNPMKPLTGLHSLLILIIVVKLDKEGSSPDRATFFPPNKDRLTQAVSKNLASG
jgi:hypothetical protein